jgi:YHS domain-containing protein
MSDLDQFARQIETRLSAARHEPAWQPAEVAQFMAEIESRRKAFEELAPRIVRSVIRPRMKTLASFFWNAELDRTEHTDRCSCSFGYCERFPVSTSVEISVEHDERIEALLLRYEVVMYPVFQKVETHDKLAVPIQDADESSITQWVEGKLLGFVETYLRIDKGEDSFEDEVAIDPVCNMRIGRSSAKAKKDYRGHLYYFCSDECRQRSTE